jgi:hypothetical protein
MSEHIEVAHGIIRFLIHRYRPPGIATHTSNTPFPRGSEKA